VGDLRIGIIDYDGKIPNLALMKISAFHKNHGDEVIMMPYGVNYSSLEGIYLLSGVDKVYCGVIFKRNKEKAEASLANYSNVVFGGPGWSLEKKLTQNIEELKADFDLYSADNIFERIKKGIGKKESKVAKAQAIVDSGIGFISRGCIRSCSFCDVPKKEGALHRVANIADLLNPASKNLILLDNNLTANPDILEILRAI